MRPDVFTALAGVELILHAGDVGGDEILDELALIAPCTRYTATLIRLVIRAYRGDRDGDRRRARPRQPRARGRKSNAGQLLARYSADVIVYGHTHKQLIAQAEGRWVVNPGAAGARRFDLLPSVARMTIVENRKVSIELVDLAN